MEIHINTGNGMENRVKLEQWADSEIRRNLGRFTDDVRRVEVHLSDENSQKGGADDKRCMIEAHVIGQKAVAVSHNAPTLEQALSGAENKARRALDSALGKVRDHRDHTSIRTDAEGTGVPGAADSDGDD